MTKEEKVLQFIAEEIAGTEFEGHVFLAGGAVRDEVMNLAPKDIDLMIDFDNGGIEFANWITKNNDCFVEGSNPVTFPKFGTAKFNLRGTNHEEIDIECVMTRSEKYERGSRKPEVEFASLKDDVLRRDLTINSLLKNISTGEILDLTGFGIADIKAKLIRTPLDENITFTDDPLRMLRVIRFAAKFNFMIGWETLKGIENNAEKIETISFERIHDELNKIIVTDNVTRAFELLKDTGLLKFIIPELIILSGLRQNKFHAFDVWGHIFKTVENTEKILVNRWAALLHDIGKDATWEETDTGVHFFDHHIVGTPIAEGILKRLKFSNEFTDAVTFIVRHHMRFKDVKFDGTGISDKGLRKIKILAGDNLTALLDVMNADNISHGTDWDDPRIIDAIEDRLRNLRDLPKKPTLPVNGNDIMVEFDIPAGPEIGRFLKFVEDAWFSDPQLTKDQALELIKNEK